MLLVTVIHFNDLSLVSTFNIDIPVLYTPAFWSALIIGILYGSLNGLVDWRLDNYSYRKMSLGLLLLIRSAIYFLVLVGMIAFSRYVLWELIWFNAFYEASGYEFTEDSWRYISIMIGTYSLILAPGIAFINQMNKKFGPGVLLPMLFGKYRRPQEEERLFMILDMKSSTTHAENLGHVKYSSLIQDYFYDINRVLFKFNGDIYQYVGDEIVITWLRNSSLQVGSCFDFFFNCQKQFHEKSKYYQDTYGLVPEFKAGVHIGKVMAVEVGDIKREIAYHGDTLNTTARIQGVCNQYGKALLVSEEVTNLLGSNQPYQSEFIGELALRGKGALSRLYSISK